MLTKYADEFKLRDMESVQSFCYAFQQILLLLW